MALSVSYLTAQALGFATGAALCWLAAALVWQSRVPNRGMWTTLLFVASLWPTGSLAMQLVLLSGGSEGSLTYITFSVVAWSSTFVMPTVWLHLRQRGSTRSVRFGGVVTATSSLVAATLTIGFIAAQLIPGFPLEPDSITIISAYNFILQVLAATVLYGWDQSGAVSRFLTRAVLPSIVVQWSMLLLLIHVQMPREATLALMFASQQSTIPTCILAAGFLARFRYADALLKYSLALVISVVVVSLSLWWIPGISRGVPLVTMSLFGSALLLAASPGYRALSRFVDRRLLRRPDYRLLASRFETESDHVANEDELFVRARERVADALDAATVDIAPATASSTAASHRIPLRSPHGDFVLSVVATPGGRRLLEEETVFLRSIARGVERRLALFELERERRERRLHEERLEHSLTNAELRALRAQVDPHFLFNTLNTVADLITSDPHKAETMTERLAEFFRYTLSRSDRMVTTVEQELQFVRHYLDIEQVRFGDRLHTELVVDPAAIHEQVPVLILQPLVENAVRHGLAPKPQGGTISVRAACEDRFIHLQVSDDGIGLRDEGVDGSGIGLQNVRRRLQMLYGNGARMVIDSGCAGGASVSLWLPRWRLEADAR